MSILSKSSSLNLQTKIIVAVLLLFLGSIWMLTFLISKHLEQDMTAEIQAQQFLTASYIADSIENQVKLRLESLGTIASSITPELISNPSKLRELLSQRISFSHLFQNGVVVISKEGKGIADYPMLPGRSTATFTDREHFKEVIAMLKPAVGKPQIGRFHHKPYIAFAVPIFNHSGKLMGVLTASVLVSDPSLLGTIATSSYKDFPDRLILVSPKYRIVITGSDPTRIMIPTPKTGVNPVRDKFMAGFEGSGIAVNARGISMLLTAKQIPTPGWFIRVGIPTEMVFAPIKRMKIWAYSIAFGLSMLSSLLLWLVIRQALRPLYAASKLIQDITDKRLPLQNIPVTTHDEVGRLLTSFNTHLDYRKQAEEALQESEEAYRSLASTADGMVLVDRNCRIQFGNDNFMAGFGHRRNSVIGRKYDEFHNEENSRIFADAVKYVFETGKSYQDEWLGEKVDKWLLRTFSPVKKADGSINVVTVVAKDITDRKRAEEERQTLEERLHRSEKMESLGTLAGGVAHDMNNVLGVLSGYSELLQEAIPEGNPLKPYVNNILAASEKGAAIIQDLLTLARRGVMVSEVVNINSITADFLKSPIYDRIRAHHPQVRFMTDLSPDLLNIKGSAIHLEKTVMNLVSNAAESITGRGTITIRTENRYLDKPVHGYERVREGDYVVLTVSDTGGGIPSADLDKIFEPFYTKKKMGRSGTGLGLAIVWGTVKDHEGYLDVESIAGRGSTFTLYFPVTREDFLAEQKKIPVEQYLGREESILVVDDVSEQRGVATSILNRLGYKVHTVSSGEEAVEYLRSNHADLVVLDMIMEPGIDGLETYERIISIKPKQKAIIVSGFSETDRVKKAQELGAGAYVKKPYLKEKIGMAVRQELDRK